MTEMEASAVGAQDAPGGSGLRLLVVIPALDEQDTVGDVVRGVPAEIPGIDSVEIVVVDDGSSDETGARAQTAGARVIAHPVRRGVGAAFHTGMAAALESGLRLCIRGVALVEEAAPTQALVAGEVVRFVEAAGRLLVLAGAVAGEILQRAGLVLHHAVGQDQRVVAVLVLEVEVDPLVAQRRIGAEALQQEEEAEQQPQ